MLPSVHSVAPFCRLTMLLNVSAESPVAVEMICASCPAVTDSADGITNVCASPLSRSL
jgi:hypothetical protein